MDNVYEDVISGVYRLRLISPSHAGLCCFTLPTSSGGSRPTSICISGRQRGPGGENKRQNIQRYGCHHPTARTTTGHDVPTPPVCVCVCVRPPAESAATRHGRRPLPPLGRGESSTGRAADFSSEPISHIPSERPRRAAAAAATAPSLTSDRTVTVNQQQEHL